MLPPYYAFLHYCTYGRGTSLRTQVFSDTYSCDRYPEVPYLDAQAALCDDGSVTVFAINRSLTDELELQAVLHGFEDLRVEKHVVVTADDPKATNTEEAPDLVTPREDGNAACAGGKLQATLPKMSWNVIRLVK